MDAVEPCVVQEFGVCVRSGELVQAKEILKSLGMNFTEAVNIFTAMVVQERGLPFDATLHTYPAVSKEEAREKVDRSLREMSPTSESMPHRFRSSRYISDESVRDMIVKGYTICYAIREERVHVLTVFRQRDYDG